MATATEQANGERTIEEAAELLEQILDGHERGNKSNKVLNECLTKRIPQIEGLLPKASRGEAERLVKRAMLTFSRDPRVMDATLASKVRCVLEGAELGLPIDGRLGHAVPYKNTKRDADNRVIGQELEANFQPDWKGLLAVAKRNGAIFDAHTRLIFENDKFRHGQEGAKKILEWEPAPFGTDSGKLVGAFAVVVIDPHEEMGWGYEVMTKAELDAIKDRSKNPNGPWKTDTHEMYRKTVFKRLMKSHLDGDSLVVKALDLDDREYADDTVAESRQRVSGDDLANPFGHRVAHPHREAQGQQENEQRASGGKQRPEEPSNPWAQKINAGGFNQKEKDELSGLLQLLPSVDNNAQADKLAEQYQGPDSALGDEASMLAGEMIQARKAQIEGKSTAQQGMF